MVDLCSGRVHLALDRVAKGLQLFYEDYRLILNLPLFIGDIPSMLGDLETSYAFRQ